MNDSEIRFFFEFSFCTLPVKVSRSVPVYVWDFECSFYKIQYDTWIVIEIKNTCSVFKKLKTQE